MADAIELLSGISPSLKVGWTVWMATALALVAWFRLARTISVPAPIPLAVRPVAPLPARQFVPLAVQKERNVGGQPPVAPATPSAAPQPSQEDDRSPKKLRRRP